MKKKLVALSCLLIVIVLTLLFSHFYPFKLEEGFNGYSDTLKAALKESQRQDDEAEAEDRLLLPESSPGSAPGTAPGTAPGSAPSKNTVPINNMNSGTNSNSAVVNQSTTNKEMNSGTNSNSAVVNQSTTNKESFQTLTTSNSDKLSKKRNNNKVFEHIFSDVNNEFKLI